MKALLRVMSVIMLSMGIMGGSRVLADHVVPDVNVYFTFSMGSEPTQGTSYIFYHSQPGTVRITASWEGTAPELTLFLSGGGHEKAWVTGSSPITFDYVIAQDDVIAQGGKWKLTIFNSSRLGGASGYVQAQSLVDGIIAAPAAGQVIVGPVPGQVVVEPVPVPVVEHVHGSGCGHVLSGGVWIDVSIGPGHHEHPEEHGHEDVGEIPPDQQSPSDEPLVPDPDGNREPPVVDIPGGLPIDDAGEDDQAPERAPGIDVDHLREQFANQQPQIDFKPPFENEVPVGRPSGNNQGVDLEFLREQVQNQQPRFDFKPPFQNEVPPFQNRGARGDDREDQGSVDPDLLRRQFQDRQPRFDFKPPFQNDVPSWLRSQSRNAHREDSTPRMRRVSGSTSHLPNKPVLRESVRKPYQREFKPQFQNHEISSRLRS